MKKHSTLFYLTTLISFLSYGQSQTILIGQIDNLQQDTVTCELLVNGITRQFQTHKIPVRNKRFELDLRIKASYLFSLKDGENYVNGIIEPGDKISITYDAKDVKHSLAIKGTGQEKIQLFNSLTQDKLNKKISEQVPSAKDTKYPFDYLLHFIDSCENFYLQQLELIKGNISHVSYQLLKGEIKGTFLAKKYYSFGYIYNETMGQTMQARGGELTPKTKDYIKSALLFEDIYSNSPTYVHNVYNIMKQYYDEQASDDNKKNIQAKYKHLGGLLSAKLRKQILTLFLHEDLKTFNEKEDIEVTMKEIYQSPGDNIYRKYIIDRYEQLTALKDGMVAPEFSVEDVNGQLTDLVSLKGKIVYMDFWFAACGPCHVLFERLKPVKDHFKENNKIVFLTISVDRKDVWKKALEKYAIHGYHVFTQNKEREHSIIRDYKVAEYPATFLIGRDGKIFKVTPANNADELIKQIEEALIAGNN